MSIAVIHHLSTESRRLQAIQEINRILKIGGEALIYVCFMNNHDLKMKNFKILKWNSFFKWMLQKKYSEKK